MIDLDRSQLRREAQVPYVVHGKQRLLPKAKSAGSISILYRSVVGRYEQFGPKLGSGVRTLDHIETYKGYEIRAFEREPSRWLATIRKADGSRLEILPPSQGGGLRASIMTSHDTLTMEAAIALAKQAIDCGGMR